MSLNSIYLTVGGLIIAVFLAALAGPFFVDWNAYRPAFEHQAERLIGQKVKVLGEAEAFLLPTPYVTFTDVRIGDAENPLMIVSRFSARVELPPLLKGEIRVIDMTLERPEIRLSLDENGRVVTLGERPSGDASVALTPDTVAFEKIDIVNGSLRLSNARSGRFHDIDAIDMTVTARTLAGPFRADGTMRIAGTENIVAIATGALDESGAIRVKTQVKPAGDRLSLLLDGPLKLKDGVPDYSGTILIDRPAPDAAGTAGGKTGRLDRQADVPWRAEGAFELNDEHLALDALEITYGTEDRRVSLTGTGAVKLVPTPTFDVSLAAKQIDLDRMLAGDGATAPADPAAARTPMTDRLKAATDALRRLPLPPIDGRIRLDVGGIVMAGGALQSVAVDLAPTARGWHVNTLTAHLPGRSDLTLAGDLTLYDQGGPRLEADLSLDIGQPAGLAAWWRGSDTLVGGNLEPFSIAGRLTVHGDGIALTEARLRTRRSLARGDYVWQPARGDKHASLSLDVTADHLESEQLLAATQLALADLGRRGTDNTSPARADIFVRVKSDTLLVGDVEAAGVEALVSYAGETLTVDRLILEDLAGARVVADGTIRDVTTVPDGDLDIAVTAKSMDGIAGLAIDAFPGSDIARRLMSASSLLAPAVLSAQFSGRADGETTNAKLHIAGEAGGSELRLDTTVAGRIDRWRDADIALDGELSGPGAPHILGQLGFDVLPVDTGGRARITLTAKGKPGDTMTVTGKAALADSSVTADGTASFADKGMRYGLDVALKSPDLTPLALMTGRVLPVLAGEVPADLKGRLEGGGGRLALSKLAGSIAGVAVSGDLAGDFKGAMPTFRGSVQTGGMDLAFLSELALGADVWSGQKAGATSSDAKPAGRWPSVPFGQPLLGALNADIDVTAKSVSLSPSLSFDDARFHLALSPDGMALDQVSGRILGGKATGSVQIKRSTGAAGLSATIRIGDGEVAALIGEPASDAALTGRFDLALDVDSTGRSIAALVSGLAGSGSFTVRDATVPGFADDAFTAAIAAVDDGSAMRVGGIDEDAVRAVFTSAFATGHARPSPIEGVLSIASGSLWARNIPMTTTALDALGTTSLDLSTLTLDSEWTVAPRDLKDSVDIAAPRITVRYAGPADAPTVTTDIAPLLSYLNLRAYELEQRRVDKLKDEILERDRLRRELRKLREDRTRREEADKAKAEAARAKAEAEARRREEARKAEELRRQADEAAKKAIRDAEEAARGLVAPAPAAQPLANEIGAAIDRARKRQQAPAGANQLLPLPQAIEVAPPPGGVLPGVPAHNPLTLVPAPAPATTRAPAKTRQPPKSRYIEGPGSRLIIMPN